MKRFLSILLTLCCIATPAAPSLALNEPLRILGGSGFTDSAYQQLYPDRATETVSVYDDQGRDCTRELLMAGDWDVACVSTRDVSLAQAYAAGLAADLSGVRELADKAAGLYPAIRNAVSAEGRLVAVPGWVFGLTYQMEFLSSYADDPDAAALLEQLGYTAQDAPRTYEELCALALDYMALDAETRRGSTFLYLDGGRYEDYFLPALIERYHAQHVGGDGRTDFDTETFRSALDGLDAMLTALNSDRKLRYGKDQNGNRRAMRSLISLGSNGLMGYGSVTDVPFLTVGDVQTIPADLDIIFINPHTERMEEALDWLRTAADALQNCEMIPRLYAEIDYDALLRKSYDNDIAAQIKQNEDQSVIDELIRLRDAGDESRYTPRAAIASYAKNIAPYLVFPRCPYLNTEKLTKAYTRGELTHEELIRELNLLSEESVR